MLNLENITLKFGERNILNNFSMQCHMNEITGIIAPSGTGKTSLFNLIMGFNPDFMGKISLENIELNSKNLHSIRKRIAYLPQNVNIIGNGTVKNTILKPFQFKENRGIMPNDSVIEDYLTKFNLNKDILENDYVTASGGEKQRIALIIALLLKRDLIILDEPTAALDIDSKNAIADCLKKIENKIILIATHDDLLLNICNKIIRLNNESI